MRRFPLRLDWSSKPDLAQSLKVCATGFMFSHKGNVQNRGPTWETYCHQELPFLHTYLTEFNRRNGIHHPSADGFTKDSKLMTQTNANQWLIDPSQYKLFAWRSLGHIQRNPSQLKDIHVLRIISLTKSITLIANNRTFSVTCLTSMQIYWNIRKEFNSHRTGWNTNMAAFLLFWNTDMAAVTSSENAL